MTNDFRSYNAIFIVYDRMNENHWSLLIIHYFLLITRNTNTLNEHILENGYSCSFSNTSR